MRKPFPPGIVSSSIFDAKGHFWANSLYTEQWSTSGHSVHAVSFSDAHWKMGQFVRNLSSPNAQLGHLPFLYEIHKEHIAPHRASGGSSSSANGNLNRRKLAKTTGTHTTCFQLKRKIIPTIKRTHTGKYHPLTL
jgi:hypothetical protein